MSLTEREKEIARQSALRVLESLSLDMDDFIIETISWRICGLFLSRIREEQEAAAWMYQHEDTGQVGFVDQQQIDQGFEKHNPRLQLIGPLFTIPPASDCKELVEALEKITKMALLGSSLLAKDIHSISSEVLAKHKASMGEK